MPEMGALVDRDANVTAAHHHLRVRSLLSLHQWWAGVTVSASANQKQNRLLKLLSHHCSSNTHLVPSSTQQLLPSGHGSAAGAHSAFPLPAARALNSQAAAVNPSLTELVQPLVAANSSLGALTSAATTITISKHQLSHMLT